ncbi:polysaccharide deacetylase family protein [Neobacillus sp. NPDC097160]|uniref:polysaccharide deacetylase family protein n=1 Tax=Neobacillus sp. NPDC097160 TaxID=3364298 RepID=UPI0037FFB852
MREKKLLIIFAILLCSTLFFGINTVPAKASGNQDGIPILMYHHILKKSENGQPQNASILNLEAFEEQMKYLSEQGYYTATLSEFAAYMNGQISLPNRTVVITFDDGYKSNYLYAYPVLKKYGLKAGLFLVTSWISDKPVTFNPTGLQFLSWPELNEMRGVFEYGGHTNALHYTNKGVPALLTESEQVILKDFETSRKIVNTPFFAYPYGGHNKRTTELVNMSGYKFAFTTTPANAKSGNNSYEIGRKAVGPSTTMAAFKEMVKSGSSIEGWTRSGTKWYYLDANGAKQTGWLKWGRYWFYLDQSGAMKTGWVKSGSSWYFFENSGIMLTGWNKQGANWYYFDQSGAMRTGWVKSDGTWYLLEQSGAMRTGWVKSDGNWYYLGSNGAMKTGWVKSDGTWYYLEPSGAMKTGWVKSDGTWYYLEPSGAMKTGWVKSDGYWYFLEPSGAMKTGWLKSDGTWYYLEPSGAMKTGWLQSAGDTYYLDGGGSMRTGWAAVSGKWYYFENNGVRKTGWLETSEGKYFLNNDGTMATGWIQTKEKWYYLYSTGLMAVNTEIDGYQIGSDGTRVEVPVEVPDTQTTP